MIEERRVQGRKDPKTGKVSKPTVRYDVRYRGPDGKEHCKTFHAKKEAEKYEREQRTALDKGAWIDPRDASEKFGEYVDRWLADRHDLRPRTVELYESLLKLHIKPRFGGLPLGKVASSSALVRSWNAELAREYPTTAAKAYRLFHQLCSTAVADGVIGRNPCTVKGAGQEHSPERPTATVAEVSALASAMPPDLRLTVVLAAYCQLRRGEVLGLERHDFDLLHGEVTISRSVNRVRGGLSIGPPKTGAGERTLKIPEFWLSEVGEHLASRVGPSNDAPFFTGPEGGRLSQLTLNHAFQAARQTIGRPELRFHDCRHSGLTWSAATGATTAEIMRRAGHKSAAAAMRYQHATSDRDAVLAAALSEMAQAAPVITISEGSRDIRGMEPKRAAGSSPSIAPEQGEQLERATGIEPA